MPKPFQLNPVALLLSAALPFGVAAQTNPPRDAELPEIKVNAERVGKDYAPGVSTVGARTPTELRDIPQSVTVINRAVLDAQGATSLTEALRNVPGITISAGEGGQIGDNVNLRGFSARTDLYLDGMRDRGQYSRDTFSLDAIEVLRGPSSMLFGRGSTGGVINQVTKKPDLVNRGEATLSVGTDNYRRASIDVNRALSETSALRIAAFGQDIDSTRDIVNNKDWGIAPSLRLGIGTPTEITLSALIQRNRDIPDYGFPLLSNGPGTVAKPIAAPASRFYGYTDDHYNQDVDVLGATVQHKISPTLTLRNQTQYSKYRTDASPTPLGTVARIGGGTPTLADPLDLLTAQRQNRDRVVNDSALYNQTDLIAKLHTGAIAHTLTTGLEIGQDEYTNDFWAWNPTNVPINLGTPVNGTRTGTRYPQSHTSATSTTLAAYINDEMTLNPRWKVVGGLRWERFRTHSQSENFQPPAPLATAAAAVQSAPRTDIMVSPRAGLIYQPDAAQSYYVSYGVSFNPSAEAVTQTASNAALAPEKNRSYEVGAKWDLLGGNLQLSSAVFRVEKTDARTTDPVSGITDLAGNVHVNGFEISTVGRITPAWQVTAGYTFLDGRIDQSNDRTGSGTVASPYLYAQGKTLSNTPRHSATLWTTWRFQPAWEAGGGVTHASDRYVNNYESAMIDGYTRYDATLAYLQKAWDVRLNLQNLGNATYFEAASGGRATPVRGRTAIVTLAYRF